MPVPEVLVTVVDDVRFPAMGSDCHLQVVDGPTGLVALLEALVHEDERRWSRFRDDSEVARIDAAAGRPTEVSPETAELLRLALDARAASGGRFDPLLGAQIRAAGYDRSFDRIDRGSIIVTSSARSATAEPVSLDVTADGGVLHLPAGARLDLGGIAKGHTADRVVAAALAAGAAGVCANVGGDLACAGDSADGSGWWASVDHRPDTVIGLAAGGVATSTTTRRRWSVLTSSAGSGQPGRPPSVEEAHHLLDPATGRPARTDVSSATVVAPTAALAEVLAKVVVLAPVVEATQLLARHRAAGVATSADGEVRHLGPIEGHLAPHPGAAR